MQGIQVWSLVLENSKCCEATKPVLSWSCLLDPWATAPEATSSNYWSVCPRACAPQQGGVHTTGKRSAATRESLCKQQRPSAASDKQTNKIKNHNSFQQSPFYFLNLFFNWKITALQYCVGFCHIWTWISHRYTYVPASWTSLSPSTQSLPPQVVTEHWVWAPCII